MGRALFGLSLILNVVFAFFLMPGVQPDTARTANRPAAQVVDDGQGSAASNPPAATIASYYRVLDTKGLDDNERAALMLAYLQERFGSADGSHERDAIFCDSPGEVLDRARDEALLALGSGAVEDPVFGCLFRPLRREYAELGAKKQMEMQRLLESYARVVAQADSYSAKKDSYATLLAKAAEVLSSSEYDEFMLRASPLAKSIRRMNLELNASELRTLVQLLARDDRLSQLVLGNGEESGRAAFHNARIAELLGRERYLRFSYSVDPLGVGAPTGQLGGRLAQDPKANGQGYASYRPLPITK